MNTLASVVSVPVRGLRAVNWEILRLFKPNKPNRPDFRSLPRIESELARYEEVYANAHQNLLREWVRYGRLDMADSKEIGRFSLMRRQASMKIAELLRELDEYHAAWHARHVR